MRRISSTLEITAGQVIIAGFDGRVLPAPITNRLSRGGLGGLILFKRNIGSPAEVRALLDEARRRSLRPLLLSVDQEGGRVVRLGAPLTVLPPMRAFGAKNDLPSTRAAGVLVGRELGALGFNLNFAPVLDVDTRPDSPVIGDRAFSGDPDIVMRHGIAFGEGLQEGGVLPCAKHFPGHGDAAVDSHLALPTVSSERTRLDTVEMAPFARWAAKRVGPIMTAHVMYPALDPHWPGTLSSAILCARLKTGLGFDGVVFSDDLEMGAMGAFGDIGAVAVRALTAGVDGLLVCRTAEKQDEVVAALAKRAADDAAFARRLDEAVLRLATLRFPLTPPEFSWIGGPDQKRAQAAVLSAIK